MGFVEALRAAAEIVVEDSGREIPGVDHVFSLTDVLRCPARYIYALKGYKPDPVAELHERYISFLGRVAHSVIEAAIGGDHEVPVLHLFERGGRRIAVKGRADVVVRDAVVEIKSYAYRAPVSRLPLYSLQAVFYAAKLGKGKAYLLLFNRASPEVVVIPLHEYKGFRGLDVRIEGFEELKRRAVEIVEARAARLAEAVEAGEARPEPGKWCRFCPFRYLCITNAHDRIMYPEFAPELFPKKVKLLG